MFLLDTNIVLEILLDKQNADNCCNFITSHQGFQLFMTDFSYFSINLKLFRLQKYNVLRSFHEEMIERRVLSIIRLEEKNWESLIDVSNKFKLDFDDSYQYVVASEYGLQLVSYDKDFDSTPIQRIEP